jgi:serine/threonine-protein kinase
MAKIDELCDSFEAHLKAGQQPNIDDILNGHPEPFRSLLACELRKVEQDHCRRQEQGEPAHRFNGYIHHTGNSATTEETRPFVSGGQEVDEPLPHIPGFEVLAKLGEGGMGIVYLARDLQLAGRLIAIKMMRSGRFASRAERQQFYFEAEAVAALKHDNIVTIYAAGEHDGQPFLCLEYLEHGSLAEGLKEHRYTPEEAARLVADVARAVQHAHDHGVLHRDLKPGNILFDAKEQPHVTDFGLARWLGDDQSLAPTGTVLGTPWYMAPEQARGEKFLTTRADVYALGAILYELLTGERHREGKTAAEALAQAVSDHPIVRPRTRDPKVPSDLEAVCLKCLEYQPTDRYNSARELTDDLERFLRGEPVSVRRPGFWDWLMQTLRNRPESSPDYNWWILFVYALVGFLQHGTIALLVFAGQPVWTVWVALVAGWIAMGAALATSLGRFRQVPRTERHSLIIGVGLLIAEVLLAFIVLQLSPMAPEQAVLALYPPLTLLQGLAAFTLGSTHWGQLLPLGLAIMGTAVMMAAWPPLAPALFAIVLSFVRVWWGVALLRSFSGRPAVSA